MCCAVIYNTKWHAPSKTRGKMLVLGVTKTKTRPKTRPRPHQRRQRRNQDQDHTKTSTRPTQDQTKSKTRPRPHQRRGQGGVAVQPPVPEHPFSKKALSKRGVAVRGCVWGGVAVQPPLPEHTSQKAYSKPGVAVRGCVWGGVPVRKKFGHRETHKKKTRDFLKKCVLCETVTKNNTKNQKMKSVSEIWWVLL